MNKKHMRDEIGGTHKATLQKWGNSLAVRIPTHLAKNIGVDNGSEMELQLCDDGIMIRPAKTKPTLDDLLAKIKGRPNPHLDYDFGKPEGKEYI
jgi:antitoxin MazE